MIDSDGVTDANQHIWDAIDRGVEWFLPSPIVATGLEVDGYRLDIEVVHRLASDTVGHADHLVGIDDAAPVVRAIRRVERIDGGPLGRSVTLDLHTAAIDTVIRASREGHVHVARGNGSYRTGFGAAWTATAVAVARAIGTQPYRRFKWTPERDALLAAAWRAGRTATEIGDMLGFLPSARVRDRKRRISQKYGLEERVGGRPRKGSQ